jgi:hypothetical protein
MIFTFAGFTISGSPYSYRGFDGTNGQTLDLKLEATPAPDIYTMRYYVGRKSYGAPDLVFSPVDGVASTPTSIVTVTLPENGTHTYEILSEANNGTDANGSQIAAYHASRFLAIRSPKGRRKPLPAESIEYDPSYGWTGELAKWADEPLTSDDEAEDAAFEAFTYGSPDPEITIVYPERKRNLRITAEGNPTITASGFRDGLEYVFAFGYLSGGDLTWDPAVFRFGQFSGSMAGVFGELYIFTFRAMAGKLYCVSVHSGTSS